MKRNQIVGAVVLLFAGALLGAWFFSERRIVWTNDAYLDGYQISISSDLQARLIQLFVDEGDRVTEGQLLCQLDESILNSQKCAAQTRVAFLKKSLALEQIKRDKQKDIFEVAKQEYASQIISSLDFEIVEKDTQAAEMNCKVAAAALANGVAELGMVEELLVHTHVYAPRNGVIAKRWVVAGDVVQISQPLFSLTDIDHIWVTANLEETKVQHLRGGEKVRIHIDAYPGRTFWGTVYVVRAAAASQFSLIPPDTATGNFTKVVQRLPVKIWIDEIPSDLYLYPGLSTEVSIHIR
jgi:membrane fusion protein (multidrug efflux system)